MTGILGIKDIMEILIGVRDQESDHARAQRYGFVFSGPHDCYIRVRCVVYDAGEQESHYRVTMAKLNRIPGLIDEGDYKAWWHDRTTLEMVDEIRKHKPLRSDYESFVIDADGNLV